MNKTQADVDAAIAAVDNIVDDGFVVGCCTMSATDGHEFASYMVQAFAAHREAAMIEGARLALEAAIREVRMREGATQKMESPIQWQRRLMHEAICSLDPAQIIKEAGDVEQ